MKNYLLLGLTLCSAVVLSGCKSKESAYRQAYERSKAMDNELTPVDPNTVPVPVDNNDNVVVTPITPKENTNPGGADDSDVRTIPGGVTLISGEPLRAYSVVVGSFVAQANAEGLLKTLNGQGYKARIVKTNEVINGHTGWFRVIASSFDDKASATQSRDQLKARPEYVGAWLLYNK